MAPRSGDIGRGRPGSCTRSDRFAWSDDDVESLQALSDGSDYAVFGETKFQGTSTVPEVSSNPQEAKMCLPAGDIGESDVSKERQQRHHRSHAHDATGDFVESMKIQRWLHGKEPHASHHKQTRSFIPQLKSLLRRNPVQGGSPSAPDSADSRSASPQSSVSSTSWQPSVPVSCRHKHRPSTPSDRQYHSPSGVGRPQFARQSHLFEISLQDSSSADSALSDEEDWDLVENPMNDSVHSDKADTPFDDAVDVSESPEREYDEMVASEETQAIGSDWTVPDSAGRSQLQQETYAFEAKYPNAAPILRGILGQTYLFERVGFVRPTINPAWDQFASALDKAVQAGEVAGEGVCIAVEGSKIVGKVANDVVFTLAPDLWVSAIGQWVE